MTTRINVGVLEQLVHHRAGAANSGVSCAGPVENLILELPGASGTVDDLMASTERGLLLTRLWYVREVGPASLLLTGLTRDGVYLIENGAITGAVNNCRSNESSVDVLDRANRAVTSVRTLGRENGDYLNRTAMAPLRVKVFNMSSVSPASESALDRTQI